jgi:hypothetical protein
VAKRYPQLTPAAQQRMQQRLTLWSKLTPEQRKAAREKYRAFSKVPAAQREAVKQMVKQTPGKEGVSQPAVSGVPTTQVISK